MQNPYQSKHDFRDILCFSDVMDNLSELKELDIVPLSAIESIKEDKTTRVTIIEYQSSQVAVIDSTLLISQESMDKYYPICLELLKTFREKTSRYKNKVTGKWVDFKTVAPGFRNKFLNMCRTEDPVSVKKLNKIMKGIRDLEGYYEGEKTKTILAENGADSLFLRLVELASKIMLCLNGELTLAYNVRIDLIMMGVIKDFSGEIQVVQLSLKKFRLSYIGWWYRLIIFKVTFSNLFEKLIKSLQSDKKDEVESKDFGRLKMYWEDEYSRIIDASKTKRRSYKLWEYMIKFQRQMILTLQHTAETFKESDNGRKTDISTELEIFLIDQVISYYEKAKELVLKDIHNNCEFEYICSLIMLLHELKIDDFLESKDFYKDFINDHTKWIKANMKYFESMFEAKEEERKKWSGLTMVDYSKLESFRNHQKIVSEWDRYMAFQKNVSTGGKIDSKPVKKKSRRRAQ